MPGVDWGQARAAEPPVGAYLAWVWLPAPDTGCRPGRASSKGEVAAAVAEQTPDAVAPERADTKPAMVSAAPAPKA